MAQGFVNIMHAIDGTAHRNDEEYEKRKRDEVDAQVKTVNDKNAADDLRKDNARADQQRRRLAAAGGPQADGAAMAAASPLGGLGQTPAPMGGKKLLGA
jgi:hypothetical protein